MNLSSNTAVVELRCDLRDVATIADFYTKASRLGNPFPPSRGSLVRRAIADFANLLKDKGFQSFETTSDAMEFLKNVGFSNSFNRRGSGKSILIKTLLEEGTESSITEETESVQTILKTMEKST